MMLPERYRDKVATKQLQDLISLDIGEEIKEAVPDLDRDKILECMIQLAARQEINIDLLRQQGASTVGVLGKVYRFASDESDRKSEAVALLANVAKEHEKKFDRLAHAIESVAAFLRIRGIIP